MLLLAIMAAKVAKKARLKERKACKLAKKAFKLRAKSLKLWDAVAPFPAHYLTWY